ncbi:MAG: glycoside hydrolase family 15 protein, partial [Actinomycetota bacterium]|nr:glycoside hydrolase family 15 protein [Actinomycetota bacterium]
TSLLIRLVRALDEPVDIVHELSIGGFGSGPPALWDECVARVEGLTVSVGGVAAGSPGRSLLTTVKAEPGRWRGWSLGVGREPVADDVEMAARLSDAEARVERLIDTARLPRHHPERARDALLVLDACTYRPTGAVVAAPTTSLPEAPGGTAQWDYRFTWLRDASLAVSVAALLGKRSAAERYLRFVHDMTKERNIPSGPLTDVRGETVPAEREVDVAGWAASRPVRVGNDARDQVQYDALGLLVQAVSVYLQTGGSLDPDTWDLIKAVAEELAGDLKEKTNGIWELREELPLLDADIGRWLALDNALWIARLRHPLTKRRHWKRARDEARQRVLGAIRPDGGLPQAHDAGRNWSDASALMIPLFALLGGDARASALIDAVRADLGAPPFLFRFPPETPYGREGAFLPVSWWAATALAVVGRYDEARELADAMCARLPRLLAEEVDPETGASLGNTPLVWSHMEAARTMYVLDAARVRQRYGPLGLALWRIRRYVQLRRLRGADEEGER